ncbi:DNA-binding transcriptional LysR family regulator [Yoonia maricola]|uniref:DNA-binding transcriptional LysR family regulator n=1 Tax=Yoonia maricola TaxID=420999 RepID=A0A2M8W4Z1_9RHOB|nr:LysR family transcriptional regulator [Yoonia maricola]PJI85980.1 DNA-binding transcriptional LysR family regulator [Yoonia maricola]
MDRLDAMQLFVRIVERRSFTAAAHDTGTPRSTVTEVIQQMEQRLGVQLLHRTTRVVRPTLDGQAYYQRCLSILNDIEEADSAFAGAPPKGHLRIEVQGTLARHFLMPGLPDFLSRYPEIEISISERDRWVDLVEEGVDCAVRWGELPDSDLIVRPLGMAKRITCASPRYLENFGEPTSLSDLEIHKMVGIWPMTTGAVLPLDFVVKDEIKNLRPSAQVSVNGPESYRLSTLLGLGLAQMPLFHIDDDLRLGRLCQVLAKYDVPSVPVSLLYPRSRQLSSRVRVFIDWAVRSFQDDRFM